MIAGDVARHPVAPLVSVVVPIFEAGAGVEQMLAQLLALTYPNTEFIFVDDASGDDTGERLSAGARLDSRMTVYSLPENAGPGPARNLGLSHAVGEYVWFADWDDRWSPEILDRFVELAETTNADVVVSPSHSMKNGVVTTEFSDGRPLRGEFGAISAFDLFLTGEISGTLWNKLFRREILGVEPFPAMRIGEDFAGLLRILTGDIRITATPEVYYTHVLRAGSLSSMPDASLQNRAIVVEQMRAAAAGIPSPRRRHRQRLMLGFEYSSWYLPRIGAALRSPTRERAMAELQTVRSEMRVSDMLRIIRSRPLIAARCLAVKMLPARLLARFAPRDI